MSSTKEMDMTKGPVLSQMFRFGVPVFFGMIFQRIYNFADVYIVGHYLGDEALAAVSIAGTVMFLLLALNTGVTTGVGVVLSQYFGGNKQDEMKKAYIASAIVAVAVTILITVVGLLTAEPLLKLMQTSDELMPYAKDYLIIVYIGCVGTMLYNFSASVLRAVGNSFIPLVFLIVASVLNVVLDILFVAVIPLGTAGAALATVVAQLISGVFCMVYAKKILTFVRVKREEWKVDFGLIKEILKYAIPATVQMSIITISDMTLQAVINTYGTAMIVGYGVCLKVEGIGWELTTAVGSAVGTFTGQNVGARNMERVRKGIRCAHLLNVIATGAFGVIIYLTAPVIMSAFTESSEAIRYGVEYMRIFSCFFLAGGLVVVFQYFLRSAGDVLFTLLMGVSEVITRIGLALLLPGIVGYVGLWFVSPITWTVAAIVGMVRYYSNTWVKKAEKIGESYQ